MLNVPEIIDTVVYSTNINSGGIDGDIRHKYLRIHFINGEYDDITNQNIVQESLNFNESLCSSDSFKFGLCEAAEVTFETVGIPNITGCKIQVFYEVDVSDLDEEHHCAGRYISEIDNCNRTIGDEVTRGVYSIPIGEFTVIEAERSKSDMTHRSIRAITRVFETNDDLTPFERWRLGVGHKSKTFKFRIPHYIDAQFGHVYANKYDIDEMWNLNDDGEVKECCYYGSEFKQYYIYDRDSYVSDDCIYISLESFNTRDKCLAYTSVSETEGSVQKYIYPYLYSPLCKKYAVYNIKNNFDNVGDYPAAIIDYEDPSSSFERFYDDLKYFIYYAQDGQGEYPYRQFYDYFNNISKEKYNGLRTFYKNVIATFGVQYSKKTGNIFTIKDNPYIYPFDDSVVNTNEAKTRAGRIIIPTVILIGFRMTYGGIQHAFTVDYQPNYWPNVKGGFIDVYECTSKEEKFDMTLKFDNTLITNAKTYKYTFYNAFTMRDIVNGYLEINASFGHQKRNGKYEYLNLPNPYSEPSFTREIQKSEYEKLYFDEFDIDDVGYVLYKYKKNKDDKEVSVVYDFKNGGTSIYDMTDNPIFTILDEDESITDKQLREKIEKYIDTYFKPKINVVHYYPVEMTMHAKPYLEPGDRYKMILGVEEFFYTYNLSSSISGIQVPKEEITSTTGTVIDGTSLVSDDEDDDS